MSDLVESLANAVANPHKVISSEDLLAEIHACNRAMERVRRERAARGEVLDEKERELYILGSDVVSLND